MNCLSRKGRRLTINKTQYTLIKIPLKDLTAQKFNMSIDKETEIQKGYLIAQESSLLLDQIERLRGKPSLHISEMILVVAKKNPRQEKELCHILNNGFFYNGEIGRAHV